MYIKIILIIDQYFNKILPFSQKLLLHIETASDNNGMFINFLIIKILVIFFI